MEKLSVIIPAYNRHALTMRHVEECLRSTRLPDEIIVVNDGGPENLREMLIALKPFPTKVIYARIEQDIVWNYNGACNLGIWLSTGDIIALEDTDHIPGKTLYQNALQILSEHPEIERLGVKRKVIQISELAKPMEEWIQTSAWGSNQMVTIFRRSLYLKLKGQDERFSGRYGWMTYDWVYRYKLAGTKNGMTQHYYAIIGDGGEPNLQRPMSSENRKFYKENAYHQRIQHPNGILNFTYTYEIL